MNTAAGRLIRTFRCPEPQGIHWRSVYEFNRDPTLIWEIYDKICNIPNFVSAEVGLAPEKMRVLFDPNNLIYLVDDVGIIVVNQISPGHSAQCHITFWDKRLRGREHLCRQMACAVMERWNLSCLLTAIPKESRVVLAFAKRVGFEQFAIANSAVVLRLDKETTCTVKVVNGGPNGN